MTTRLAGTLVCALAAALAGAIGGCTDEVSPPPLGDYTTWYRLDTYGNVPGHGDSYRVIYVNDVARTAGATMKDAVLVKEIRDNLDGAPGDLRYLAIMRKLRSGPDPADEGGWLFTQATDADAPEVHRGLCWDRCHAQAPLAGVWLDYTQ